jgi:hypothetical protein
MENRREIFALFGKTLLVPESLIADRSGRCLRHKTLLGYRLVLWLRI